MDDTLSNLRRDPYDVWFSRKVDKIFSGCGDKEKLIDAVHRKSQTELKRIYQDGIYVKELQQLFISAVIFNQKTMVHMLLEAGINANFCDSHRRLIALAIASANKEDEIVDMLLSYEANSLLRDLPPNLSPGQVRERLTKALLSLGMSLKLRSQLGHILLLMAISRNDIVTVETMLKAGAAEDINFLKKADTKGLLPLVYERLSSMRRFKTITKYFCADQTESPSDSSLDEDSPEHKENAIVETKFHDVMEIFLLCYALVFLLMSLFGHIELIKLKISYMMTTSNRIILLCCHDVERNPGPFSEAMHTAFRSLFSTLFLFYWGVKSKAELTKFVKTSTENKIKEMNVKNMYAEENKPNNWDDEYVFGDPSNAKRSYMPHEKCGMLRQIVTCCSIEEKIPDDKIIESLEAFIQRDNGTLESLPIESEMEELLKRASVKFGNNKLQHILNKCLQNSGLQVVQKNESKIEGQGTSSTKNTGKGRLKNVITGLEDLEKDLKQESQSPSRRGRKRKCLPPSNSDDKTPKSPKLMSVETVQSPHSPSHDEAIQSSAQISGSNTVTESEMTLETEQPSVLMPSEDTLNSPGLATQTPVLAPHEDQHPIASDARLGESSPESRIDDAIPGPSNFLPDGSIQTTESAAYDETAQIAGSVPDDDNMQVENQTPSQLKILPKDRVENPSGSRPNDSTSKFTESQQNDRDIQSLTLTSDDGTTQTSHQISETSESVIVDIILDLEGEYHPNRY